MNSERPATSDCGLTTTTTTAAAIYQPLPQTHDLTASIYPFLSLPKELRLQVYIYLSITTDVPIDNVSPRRFGYYPLTSYYPSLLVCKSYTKKPQTTQSIPQRYSSGPTNSRSSAPYKPRCNTGMQSTSARIPISVVHLLRLVPWIQRCRFCSRKCLTASNPETLQDCN